MRTATGIVTAGLIMAGITFPSADAAEPGRASLDTPIRNIELDTGGNVVRITFSNGAELGVAELAVAPDLVQPGKVPISGIRQLPFRVLKDGDSVVVVANFVGMTPIPVPPGKGVVLGIHEDGQVEFSLAHNPCPAGMCSFYGVCKPCALADVRYKDFPALVEYVDPSSGEQRLGVLSATLEASNP
jgi:hypothetical protein